MLYVSIQGKHSEIKGKPLLERCCCCCLTPLPSLLPLLADRKHFLFLMFDDNDQILFIHLVFSFFQFYVVFFLCQLVFSCWSLEIEAVSHLVVLSMNSTIYHWMVKCLFVCDKYYIFIL